MAGGIEPGWGMPKARSWRNGPDVVRGGAEVGGEAVAAAQVLVGRVDGLGARRRAGPRRCGPGVSP